MLCAELLLRLKSNLTGSKKWAACLIHFHEEEMAFDIHPLCLQCAIGFKEGLKIYFMLEEDLKCTYEYFSKPCSAII